jgi:phenylpropionate dioxygenase-like ring-hydroxylating dioxygenase large terminal subunit
MQQLQPSYSHLITETASDFSVHNSVYNDPEIFNAEMQRLFENNWCYVAHESEIEKPGDFRTSAIGRIPVIVSRGDDGKVYVNVNACRHRGTLVCREERGNTRYFVCPYHGWSYNKDGSLNNITDRDNFPEQWGNDISGLVAAKRVAVYRGMIFASFNEDVPAIEHYLGPLKTYVDYWFDHALAGTVRVLKPWRAVYQGNWKYQLENSTDGWHARYVHISALKTISHFGTYNPRVGWAGCTRGFSGGHGILERPRTDIPPDMEPDFNEFRRVLENHYGQEKANSMFIRRHITIFPNIQLMEFKLRVIQPVSVDKTIVYEFPVDLQGTGDKINKSIRTRLLKEISISSGSPVSGMVNADDVEIYARTQAGLASGKMEWVRLARGIHREKAEREHEWSGEDMDELPQRAIYREWARKMK